jgi:hypothetical protein
MADSTFIAHAIGPSFDAECAAAGLAGLPFSHEVGGVTVSAAIGASDLAKLQAVIATHDPSKPAPAVVPDGPTLSDYRVALTLWGRLDDVTNRVTTLAASTSPQQAMLGKIAKERLEYANNVFRAQLIAPTDASGGRFYGVFGFTAADVDESLYRAHQVSLGDLSGVWPL